MKNFNLISRLLSYSHEKQSPQRFGRYAVMLLMLLTLGVGQMWGIGFNKGNVIFRAQGWNNPSYVYLCIGKSDYTSTYQMSRIGDSDLYHVWVNVDDNDNNWWSGCTYFAVIGSSSAVSSGSWGSSSLSSKGNKGYTSAYTSSYDINNSSGCYFFNKNNSTVNNGSFSISYTTYDAIQTYNAIQNAKKRDTNTSYSNVSGTFPAPIKLKGEYLTSNASSNRTTITRSASGDGAAYTTYGAVVTGTITHSIDEENLSSDYYLEGWGTSTSPSVTTATYEYKITANTTVYAFFSHLYTLTFLPKGTYGTSTVTASVTGYTDVSSGDKIPTGHNITVTAAPATGYEIVGWYSDADCTVSLNNGTNTTYSISSLNANRGVYVKFQKKTYSITLDDNGSYQGNGSATVQYGDAALTVSSHASRTSWNLVGYWTASGDGGSQVTDAEGNLIASVSTFTDENGKWIKDANSTVSLYAHWSQSYSVTYNANGGTGTTTDASSPYAPGTDVTVLSNSFTRTGYTFTGWNTESNGTGDPYAAGGTIENIGGNVTLYAQWSENKTTVTISASPVGTGTFTVNSVSGTSASVGVTTTATVVATPATDFDFTSWTATNCSASPTNNASTTLTGNGSSSTGTLVATFTENVASGWYLGGSAPFYSGSDATSWGTSNTGYPMNKKYRGMSGVFYRSGTVTTSGYYTIHNGTTRYRPSSGNNETFSGAGYANKISMSNTSDDANFRFGSNGTYYIIADTRGATPVIWYETTDPDRSNFHSVNVTGVENAKGTCKVTLNSNGFETTRFKNSEVFKVTITGVSGYIPTITIGGTPTTWWKEQDTYYATGTMSTSDISVTISYAPTRAVTFNKTTGCSILTATGPSSTNVTTGMKIKDGTEVVFHQLNKTGYTFSKWYSNSTGTSGTQYSTSSSDYTLTISSTAYTIYPLYTENQYSTNVAVSPAGYGSISSPTPSTGKIDVKQVTGTSVTASVASSNYIFESWGKTGGGLTVSSETTNPATFKATSANGTITANFADVWNLKGNQWSSWGTYKPMTATANANEFSTSISLTKGTTYLFKVVKRNSNNSAADTWYGNKNSSGNKVLGRGASAFATFTGGGEGDNISVTPDVNGTYTFTINTSGSTPSITVTFQPAYTVTFGSDGHGTVTASATSAGGSFSSGAYVAASDVVTFAQTPSTGYSLEGWYTTVDGSTSAGLNGDNELTINTAKTVYAQYDAKTYTVMLDQQSDTLGYSADGDDELTATYDAAFPSITKPTAANGWAFMGYWSDARGKGTQFTDSTGALLANITDYSDASGHWKYDASDLTLYAYYEKAQITALTLDVAVVETNGTVGVTPTISPKPTGDTKLCFYVFHSNDNPLSPQPSISWNGTKATFSAGETSGTYKIGVALRTGTECGGGEKLDSTTVSYQVAGTHTVTVRYKCGDEVIT